MTTKTKKGLKHKSRSAEKSSPKSVMKVMARPVPAFSNSDNYYLRDLFLDELKMMYWSEKALVKIFSKMSEKCHSKDLADAINKHFEETEGHVKKLEKVFDQLGVRPISSRCEAIAGIIAESNRMIENINESSVRDAAIILSAQKVEHYEIATYGTICVFAEMLNEGMAASFLKEIISEEKSADKSFSGLANDFINVEALIEREWEE